MANIPSQTGTPNQIGINSLVFTPKVILGLALGAAIILMLADFFPNIMIGFMLLILAGVILSNYQIVTNFLNGL